MRQAKWLIAGFAATALVACGSGDKKEDRQAQAEQQPQPAQAQKQGERQEVSLGEFQTKEGQTQVETKRRVMKTVKEDIPTITLRKTAADINRMDAQDFVALGVPERTAQNIITFRERRGGFKTVSELTQVPGMNMQWFQQHRDILAVG